MTDQAKYVVLISTTGTVEEARRIAEKLVNDHLVACVNIIPSVESVYWWKDSVHQDQEVLMIIKSLNTHVSRIEETIRSLHSYEVPELIVLPLQYGLPEYLKWIDEALHHDEA